jgi:hypothetical protein
MLDNNFLNPFSDIAHLYYPYPSPNYTSRHSLAAFIPAELKS